MYDEVVVMESVGPPTWLVVVGMVLVVAAIIAVTAFVIWVKKRFTRPEMYGMTREAVEKRWRMIRETSKMNGEMGMKLALVEADTLLDGALKSIMMPGDTLGERLKVACYKYPKLKDVWWAHKLRNQLVHDHSFRLNMRETQRALDEFEKALKTLNVL